MHTSDIFENKTTIESVKISVQESSQSNHVSRATFSSCKPCPLRGTGGTAWGREWFIVCMGGNILLFVVLGVCKVDWIKGVCIGSSFAGIALLCFLGKITFNYLCSGLWWISILSGGGGIAMPLTTSCYRSQGCDRALGLDTRRHLFSLVLGVELIPFCCY